MAVYGSTGDRLASLTPDNVLTNISLGWDQGAFVGNLLFPSVPVSRQGGKYPIFGREQWGLPPENDLRAPGAVASEIGGRTISDDNYWAEEHALRTAVPVEEEESIQLAGFNPLRDGTEDVMSALMLRREIAIHALATTAANYPAAHVVTLSGTSQFNDYTNSTPIPVFKTARRQLVGAIHREPNLAIIPWEVMMTLEDHPSFIERIKYSERGILTPQIIATIVGLPVAIQPMISYNSANPLQAESTGFLWGKDIWIGYVAPRPSRRTPSFGYEFNYGYQGKNQAAFRWWDQDRRSTVVELSRRYDLKIVSLDSNGKALAGYLIKNAIA